MVLSGRTGVTPSCVGTRRSVPKEALSPALPSTGVVPFLSRRNLPNFIFPQFFAPYETESEACTSQIRYQRVHSSKGNCHKQPADTLTTFLFHSLVHHDPPTPRWLTQSSSPGTPNLRSQGYFLCWDSCWQLSHNPRTTDIRPIRL